MKASKVLIDKIKEFERLRLKSYKCPAGVWTIGYGHTKGVKPGQVISKLQAEVLLKGDILICEKQINGLRLSLTQGQFDTLVDFDFNMGYGKLVGSTLLKLIKVKAGTKAIQEELKKWCHGGGLVLDGLVERRVWEAERWTEK